MSEPIKVKAHTRPRVKGESVAAEIPSIAPKEGVKIIDAKNAQGISKPQDRTTRGVKRVGGGDFGKMDKGVKRLGY